MLTRNQNTSFFNHCYLLSKYSPRIQQQKILNTPNNNNKEKTTTKKFQNVRLHCAQKDLKFQKKSVSTHVIYSCCQSPSVVRNLDKSAIKYHSNTKASLFQCSAILTSEKKIYSHRKMGRNCVIKFSNICETGKSI